MRRHVFACVLMAAIALAIGFTAKPAKACGSCGGHRYSHCGNRYYGDYDSHYHRPYFFHYTVVRHSHHHWHDYDYCRPWWGYHRHNYGYCY